MHHVHHSNKMNHQNHNFGDKLSVWDWVFRTAIILPSKEFDQIEYGIGYDYPQNLLGLTTHLFRKKEKE